MSRQQFELWGIDLDEQAFAEALAGAGAREVHDGIVEWRLDSVPPSMTVEDARSHWSSLATSRIEVQAPGSLDVTWLNATLARAAHAVYFRDDAPEVAVAWEWPLRIGFLEDDRSDELRKSFNDPTLAKLVRFVSMGIEANECELLLIPCNLRTAVGRVLDTPSRLAADCVIVIGGAKVEADRLVPLMRTLRTDVRTAGVAVASVPKEQRGQWLEALVANLSHNFTIDDALRSAAEAVQSDPPLLVCSRRLAELAKLSRYVQRLGTKMKSSAPPLTPIEIAARTSAYLGVRKGDSLEAMGAKLEEKADDYRYDAESGEATAVVELRESLEAASAEPIAVPRMSMTAPPAATPDLDELAPAAPEERFVRADFFDRKDSPPVEMIQAKQAYFLRIRIAPPGGSGAIANVALDESQLPKSETGHELTIALFELPEGGHPPASKPAQVKIHLPPAKSASSTPAWFPVLTPASGTFVARIVVLHQTRVLQTLILRAPVGSSQSAVSIQQENVVIPTYQLSDSRRQFDAAIIVNEADGAPAVMAMTPTSAVFDQPEDIRTVTDAIGTIVTRLTKLADLSDITIDDPEVVSVLIALAIQGKLLSKWISTKLPAEIASAERVQVVEAHEGSFLPLEFVYSSFAPDKDAKICPHGKQDLANPKHEKCPHERDRKFVCPSVFWGFSRVIERFPHTDLGGRDFRLSVPSPNRTKLEPFQSALVAASRKVSANDVTGDTGVVATIKPLVGNVFVADDWNDWMTQIDEHDPSMLLLFPHSEEVDDPPVAALEIGDEFLSYAQLEKPYVCRDDRDPGPVVLLLGCSTNLPKVRFQSFVGDFRNQGASIVVATLSIVRGRHATRFVKEFLGALSDRVGKPDAVFGDVLLDAKRKMLAAGDPFALTLVAYGDADWRL